MLPDVQGCKDPAVCPRLPCCLEVLPLQHSGHALGFRREIILSALLAQSACSVIPSLWNSLCGACDILAEQAWKPSWLSDNCGNAGLKTKAAQSQGASTDDRLYAFEAAGQLLGQEDLAVDEQEAAVRSLLQPLQQQMDEQLASAGKAPQGGLEIPVP